MGAAEQPPRVWRYIAGIESVGDLRTTRRPQLLVWTAAPKSRRGDVVLLYGKSPVKGYVAVARQCSDPIESRHGRFWTWLQIQSIGSTVSQDEVEARARTRGQPGLGTPAGGSYNEVLEGTGRNAILRLLGGRDERVGQRLAAWMEGEGAYPRGLSQATLADAWFEEPETDGLPDDHERWLSEAIEEWMVRTGEGARCENDSRIGGYSLERYLKIDGLPRYADIVLIDRRRPRTLLLVEVKKFARPALVRDPVLQVLGYRAQLRRDHPGWVVRAAVVAPEFHPATLASARTNRVECRRCDARGKRLRPA